MIEEITSRKVEALAQEVLGGIASRKEAVNFFRRGPTESGKQILDDGSTIVGSDDDTTTDVVEFLEWLRGQLSQIGHLFLQSLNFASQAVNAFENVRGNNRAYADTLTFEKAKILKALDTRTESKRLEMLRQQLEQNKQELKTLSLKKEALETVSAMYSGLKSDLRGSQLKMRDQREKFLDLLSKKEAAIKDHQEMSTVEIGKVRRVLKATLESHQQIFLECSTIVAMLDRSEAWWMALVEERKYAAEVCEWITQLKETLRCNKSLDNLLGFVAIEID